MSDDSADSGECTLRERKKNATREAIHDTALALVEENGLEATTVEQICESVGISPRTFFNYFPSKTAAVLGFSENPVTPAAIARFREADGELVPALCTLIGGLVEHSRTHQRVKEMLASRPEIAPAFGQWMSRVRGDFVSLAQERAPSPEAGVYAVTLVMSALNVVAHNAESIESPAADRLLETIDEMLAVRHTGLAPAAAASA